MAGRGLRSILQPVLYVGIASVIHGFLFFIPAGGSGKRDPGTTRGIRVKAYVEGPPAAATAPRPASRTAASTLDPAVPAVSADASHSMPGRDFNVAGGVAGGGSGDEGGPYGDPGPSKGPTVGGGGPAPQTEYGQYLAHLRSDGVQGWARESAKASRQGWKGSGAGKGGWGSGTGTGSGTGSGTGKGRGTGSGGGGATAYMDPRVRMVVILYPLDEHGNAFVEKARNIESRLRPIPYPDLKVKKSQYTSGWWNVYIEIRTGRDGGVERVKILRPETDGPLERVFVDQVKREMDGWTFDAETAEIHVDVRFYVE